LSIVCGRFPWSFFSYPFGLPCAVSKAFGPHSGLTTPITYSFSACPRLAATTGRFYRAFASYDEYLYLPPMELPLVGG